MYGRRGEGSDGIVCPPSHGVWGGGVEEKKKKKKWRGEVFIAPGII